MSPTEAAIAPRDITLMLIPARWQRSMLNATVTGMVSITTRLDLHALRNRNKEHEPDKEYRTEVNPVQSLDFVAHNLLIF